MLTTYSSGQRILNDFRSDATALFLLFKHITNMRCGCFELNND